jgi:hypothetical protein
MGKFSKFSKFSKEPKSRKIVGERDAYIIKVVVLGCGAELSSVVAWYCQDNPRIHP